MLVKGVVGSGARLPEFETQLHPSWLHDPKQVFSVFSFVKWNSLSWDIEDHTLQYIGSLQSTARHSASALDTLALS